MHRNDFLAKLAKYVPIDEQDTARCRKIEAFVRTHPECFNSSFAPGHLTGSAWLLNSAGDRALLTHHRKLDRWIQLGGHADGDPDLLAVAMREAREESGIAEIRPVNDDVFDLGVHLTAADPPAAGHYHFDIRFLLQVRGEDRFVVSDESHALAWFSVGELAGMDLDEDVRRMIEKWQRLYGP